MKTKLFLILFAAFVIMSCKEDTLWLTKLENKLTYDQAISWWGEPAKTYEGFETFIAEWETQDKRLYYHFIRLTFDKKTKKMTDWACVNCNYYK